MKLPRFLEIVIYSLWYVLGVLLFGSSSLILIGIMIGSLFLTLVTIIGLDHIGIEIG